MKKLLILITLASSLTLTACASEKGVLNELTNDAYQGVNEFEQVMLNLNENSELVNDFIPSDVAEDRNYSDEFIEAIERYDKVVEEKPEDLEDESMNSGKETENTPSKSDELILQDLVHPTDADVVEHVNFEWNGQSFEEIVNDIIDVLIVRAPHGEEPNTYYRISNEGPFGGAEFEMERCVDGMLHVTCYGDQDCYIYLIDAQLQMRTALERSGEMMVRVDVVYGDPSKYIPGSSDIGPGF